MAHAIAVTAKTAAEPAEQVDDHDDDEYHSERHGTLPKGRPADGTPPRLKRKAYPAVWFQRRNPASSRAVIPGRCGAPNPESRDSGSGPLISRFRVWSFGPSRNDDVLRVRGLTLQPISAAASTPPN